MKHLCTALAVSLLALIGVSCEDAKVASASKVRQDLRDASASRARSVVAATSRTDDPLSSLRQTASELESRGGSTAAAALMLADVQLEIGRATLRQFEVEEASRRGRRLQLLAMAEAIADLDATAREIEAIADDPRFVELSQQLAQQGSAARQRGGSQEGVILEQQRIVEQRSREVQRLAPSLEALRSQADDLRRDAIALRPIEALELVEQAATLRRRSDQLMVQIAERELEMLQSAATAERAAMAKDGDESIARTSDGGVALLEAVRDDFRSAAQAFRRSAEELRGRLGTDLAEMSITEDSAWAMNGAAAIAAFRASTDAARRASSGGDRSLQQSAQLLVIAARQGEATAELAMAQGFAGQASLLQRLVTLGGGTGEAWRRDFEAVNALRDEAMTRAREGFVEALESLESSESSGRPAATILRAELAAALARLADRPAPMNDPASSFGSSAGIDASASAAPSGPPFASAQALFDFLRAGGLASGDPSLFEQTFRATSPGGRRMLKVTIAMARASEPVRQAMIETFGSAGSGLNSGGMGGQLGAPMDGATLSTSDDGQATIDSPQGTLRLLAEEGSWHVDFDSLAGANGADPATMAATAGMMEAMTARLGPFFTMFAQRVRDGEFGSVEEAGAAMQQEMMAMMMQGMQGGPGGGAGPGGG